jgi:hypothetical protein
LIGLFYFNCYRDLHLEQQALAFRRFADSPSSVSPLQGATHDELGHALVVPKLVYVILFEMDDL